MDLKMSRTYLQLFCFFTSTDPSPKMQVKMGVEKKVMIVNTSTRQAEIEIRFKVQLSLLKFKLDSVVTSVIKNTQHHTTSASLPQNQNSVSTVHLIDI